MNATRRPAPIRSGALGIALVVCRVALAGVFGLAAVMKLTNPQEFAFSVNAFKILPDHLAKFAAFAIPWTELFAAAALLLGFWTRASALVLGLLLVSFIVGIVSVLERHLSVSCGCFGKYIKSPCGETLSWCNVVQNAVLLAMAAALVVFGHGRAGLDGLGSPVATPRARS